MSSSSSSTYYSLSDSSVCSDSSTVMWDHEEFETFQLTVLVFALNDVWPNTWFNDITIERMQGGGFNRIIGMTRRGYSCLDCKEVRYILRLPRFEDSQVDRDVANLRFLERHTEIPVPRVIKFDDTYMNDLDSPYMIQNRIDGVDTLSGFPQLNHAQKLRFAREFGDIFRQMLAVKSHMAGSIVFSSGYDDSTAEFSVAPLSFDYANSQAPYRSTKAPTKPIQDLLLSCFNSQMADVRENTPKAICKLGYIDRFCSMAGELEAGGWFDNVSYSLVHLDLHPRNILVNSASSPEEPIIPAVLDWDSAIFGPQFLSCVPPLWIWCWLEDEDEDERTANDDPPTIEARELKDAFEKAAGEEYMRFAYEPAYRLARRLVKFAIDGPIRSNEEYTEAEEMLEEWAAIR
ncbi:kinase-like domain-containing protein [Daldinia sp. FL1419]|nr:kinase-like domain-containing protein [Daldinia sp. FL1419]